MRIILVLLLFMLTLSCQTTLESIPEDLTPSEFFQKAQEAVVERNDYETALKYYQAFLERFPDDVQKTVEAEYEIAFIYYKLENFDSARSGFDALLAKYAADGSEILPQWPRILSEKVLTRMDSNEAATAEE